MDRVDLFRIFLRVVETGSFSRAADTLNMPRSTVSTAIQALESRVGARLLSRTTRTVSTTADGRAFYDVCLRLVADVEEAEGLFRQDKAAPRGVLRVDMPGRIGRLIVAPALPEFLQRYPDINIELGVTDRPVNLAEDGIDCVLRIGPLQDSGLIGRRVGQLALVNVASPAYLARYGTPATPQELSRHLAVGYASAFSGRVDDWEWMEDGQLRTCAMAARVTVNSAEALIACCLAGLGLIQVPAYDVQQHLRAGDLVEILPEWRAEPMPMTLLYQHRRHFSNRLQVFADWLCALLAPCLHDGM